MMTETGERVSLWTIANQLQSSAHQTNDNQITKDEKLHVRYLLVVGSEGVGKTQLINRFLDRRDDLHKAKTLALEFTFGRRAGKSLQKDVAHIWELGSGMKLLPLTQAVLANSAELYGLRNLSVILMLDLSLPNKLWNTLSTFVDYLRSAIYQQKSSKFPNFLKELEKRAWDRIDGETNPDKEFLEPFPVPLVILCGKYDVFQEYETDTKRRVCHTLRCVALTLGATLQFYSSKDVTLVKKAKDLLLCHGLGLRVSRSISSDHSKPMIIPAGTDGFRYIFTDSKMPSKVDGPAYYKWKKRYAKHFPPDPEEHVVRPADLTKDINFKEPSIDALKALKRQDLREDGADDAD